MKTGKEYKLDVQFLSLSRSLSVSATSFDIAPYADNDNKFHVQAFSNPNINLPPADTTELNDICQNFPQLRHIKFPDINQGKIGVLLGAACVPFTHSLEWIRGAHNCPSGIRTELGWTIAGEFRHSSRKKSTATKHLLFFASHETSSQSASTDILEHYWNVEKIATEPAQKDALSTHDKEALLILQDTCRHNGERYEIGLPWKRDTPLPNNYFAALSQLRSLEKRFREHPQKKAKFDETLQKDLEKGYVKQVKMQHPPPPRIWYLPTHPVENPNKPGKVRRIANAASKFKGVSLNNALLTGPDLLANLLEIILRFRKHPVGVLADIEGMFMQVAIREEDQSALRFLWLKDGIVRQYQYARLIFGATCSPSCAIFTLHRCAADLSDRFPDVYEAVLNNFYMDDFIMSFATAEAARRFASNLRTVLQHGGFRLTKFVSNNPAALTALPEEDMEIIQNTTKVLGQTWCLSNDTFTAPTPKTIDPPQTLRQLFSMVSSIFDPIGLLAPSLIQFKVILQILWKRGQTWDQPVPDDLQPRINKLATQYATMPDISVPRQISPLLTSAELHVFTDASISAFSAVINARQPPSDTTPARLVFVLGKSRVAPIKQRSVPKLELEASVLGVRLLRTVLNAFECNFRLILFWTDSCVVLDWIQNQKKLKTFVAHRVNEIIQHTKPNQWNYVPTELNPADHGTRGLKPSDISSKWTKGPDFLLKPVKNWPSRRPANLDMSICTATVVVSQTGLVDISRFSFWTRLLKTTAIVRFFIRRLRDPLSTPNLTAIDFQLATETLLRQSQLVSFPAVLGKLLRKESLSSKDKLLPLNPFIDERQFIRSSGRLQYAPLPAATRMPVVLDAQNAITRLLMVHFHEICHHAGPEYVKSFLQQRYFIFGVRAALRTISYRCFQCRRVLAENVEPMMAPLPRCRFPSPDTPYPLANSGVDAFGPFFIVNGKRTEKHYSLIFTCLVTRACHLEPCPALTTDSFINAFRRFIARRGQPQYIRSDNGKNFVGARRELQEALNAGIRTALQTPPLAPEMEWHLNPPFAPHFGGAWERLIQTAKKTLLLILGSRKLTPELFHTILAETELMLNSRPLTHVADYPDNEEPLTPNHFLLHRPYANLPPGVFQDSSYQLTHKSWKETQKLVNHIWKRLLTEYIPSLHHRSKWNQQLSPITVGELAWVLRDFTPRGIWPIGRVEAVFPGRDGQTRVCSVKTAYGTFERPAVSLSRVFVP